MTCYRAAWNADMVLEATVPYATLICTFY